MDRALLIGQLARAAGLSISLFKGENLLVRCNDRIQDYNLPMYLASSLPQKLPDIWTASTPEHVYLGGLHVRKEDCLLLIAPLFSYECSIFQAKQILYRLGRKDTTDAANFRRSMNSFHHYDLEQLRQFLLFLHHLLNGEEEASIQTLEFSWTVFFPDTRIPVTEVEHMESAQESEKRILSAIRYGKVRELTDYYSEELESADKRQSIADFERERRYLYGANMLMSRAALEAGVDADQISQLTDRYYDLIRDASTASELDYLFYRNALHYARLAEKAQKFQSDSLAANRADRYIQSHLYEELSLSSVAAALGYSRPYLSAEFKKATGMNLTDHIRACKIEEACYLLEQRRYKISEISDMLMFSSLSYFGKVFRKVKGCGPGDWSRGRKDKIMAKSEKKKYRFWGWEHADVRAITEEYKGIETPADLYDALCAIWCADTCAPRMREEWTPENRTLGQCSITAFLAQDIFGGKVYGILRPGGNYHCYNVIGDCCFDLTSEQFGEEVLNYEGNPEQFREVHFAKEEKRLRYEYLKAELKKQSEPKGSELSK